MWRAVLVAVLAALAFPGSASALPSQREVDWARSVAVSYWHGEPACGRPIIIASRELGDNAATATYSTCTIRYSAGSKVDWSWWEHPVWFCAVIVHEYGHLVLGPTYFAASNPTEPEHSPDPANIMYWEPPEHFTPCAPKRKRSGRSRP